MTLIECIRAGDRRAALELIKAGTDANESGEEGVTALMWAATEGDIALVRALLAAGADPNLEDRIGETALIKAAAAGHRPVFTLLAESASPEERDAALAYLRAAGKSDGPADEREGPSTLRTTLVEATANVARFLGDDQPAQRVDRMKRAEKNRKK